MTGVRRVNEGDADLCELGGKKGPLVLHAPHPSLNYLGRGLKSPCEILADVPELVPEPQGPRIEEPPLSVRMGDIFQARHLNGFESRALSQDRVPAQRSDSRLGPLGVAERERAGNLHRLSADDLRNPPVRPCKPTRNRRDEPNDSQESQEQPEGMALISESHS